jgi:hypothetical protein
MALAPNRDYQIAEESRYCEVPVPIYHVMTDINLSAAIYLKLDDGQYEVIFGDLHYEILTIFALRARNANG